jgi:hypothetical protein
VHARLSLRRLLFAACALGGFACLLTAGTAGAGTLRFATPTFLPQGDPTLHPFIEGGEPGLAFDPSGDGHVYVTAPQGVPTVLGNVLGIADCMTGVGYWASDDGGRNWPRAGCTGEALGGGDSDQLVLSDHSLLVADLEAVDTDICISHDFAASFPSCSNGISRDHQGPEDDREWLTAGPAPGEVYLTYHDFAGGFPIIEHSTDGGHSFAPCGAILNPGSQASANYSPTNGALVSKPMIDGSGDVYVGFMEPEVVSSPVGSAETRVYMAVTKPGCGPTTVFSDHTVYEHKDASLGNLFLAEAIDGAGRLYALVSGRVTAGSPFATWLLTSSDRAQTWSAPIQVSPPDQKATMFPTLAAGAHAGEAIIGWFGTSTSSDPNNSADQWRYYAAATYDGGQTFNETTVTPAVAHYGDICNQGIACGLVPGQPGNRDLADFASAAVDPADGCAALAIPQDPYNNNPADKTPTDTGGSSATFARQLDPATCFTAANAGKAASQVGATAGGGGASACVDRAAPVSRFVRSNLRASRRGVSVSGRSTDRGCGAGGRGRVARVSVALARTAGAKCRFLKANRRFGPPASCTRPSWLRAIGTASWRFAYHHRLAAGRYVLLVRAVDAAANVEHATSRARFSVR